MKAADREAVRATALELLRAVRGAFPNCLRASLEDLIAAGRSYEERRAEVAVFIVLAQVLAKRGLDWTAIFDPISCFDAAELRAVLTEAETALREA